MDLNFDELLNQGQGAAENVLKNRKEIKSVLHDLQNSLSKFLSMSIELKESIEFVEENSNSITRLAIQFKPKEKTGFNVVSIVSKEVDYSQELFKIRRSDEVYPITLVRDREHMVADDQTEFSSSIGQIVSKAQFHFKLKSFKKKVEQKQVLKIKDLPATD